MNTNLRFNMLCRCIDLKLLVKVPFDGLVTDNIEVDSIEVYQWTFPSQ